MITRSLAGSIDGGFADETVNRETNEPFSLTARLVVIDENETVGGEAGMKGGTKDAVDRTVMLAHIDGDPTRVWFQRIDRPNLPALFRNEQPTSTRRVTQIHRVLEFDSRMNATDGVGRRRIRRADDTTRGPRRALGRVTLNNHR